MRSSPHLSTRRETARRSGALRPLIGAIASALFALGAGAQETIDPDEGNPDPVARCEQQFSVEQCQDSDFVERNAPSATPSLDTLEIARRAAVRRAQLENRALRELTLQRLCAAPTDVACANIEAGQCAAQIAEACATLTREADACAADAQTWCATNAKDTAKCVDAKIAFCPSVKPQRIDKLLAKYPKLKPQQRAKLTQIAEQIDSKQDNWLERLLKQFEKITTKTDTTAAK